MTPQPPAAAIERLAEAIHATICGGGLHYLSPCNQGWARPILLALPDSIREATWAVMAGAWQHTRLVCASDNLLDSWGARTEAGDRITAEWGEPDERGFYTPTFTVHYDDNLLAAAVARVEALPAACRFTDCDCTVDMVCVHPEIVHVRLSAALAAVRGDSPAEKGAKA